MSFRLRPARVDRSKRTAESCPDRETTAQLGTVEHHVDFAPSKLRRWDAVLRVVCACIPDHHRPGAALAVGDHALEVGVFEWMLLGAYGQMFLGRVHGRTFGHRPGYQNPIDRQSEVIVQPTGAENGPCAHAAQSPGSQDSKLAGCERNRAINNYNKRNERLFAALKEALMPTVMITGTNRGLGFEFVKQYAADGWRVFATCRHPTSADSLRLLAERSKGLVEVVTMDVTDLRSVKQAAAQIENGAIDVLINSAGIAGKPHQKAGNVDYESWAAVFNVNTMGPLRVTEVFIDHLSLSERKLAVTLTSSMGSLTENTSGGSIAYRSSKAAVNMVMRSAAIDFAPRGVACVLINPGWVKTDMGGPAASLTPEESVTALKRLIETLGSAESGKFFDYDGQEHAW